MINITSDNITDVFAHYSNAPKNARARDLLCSLVAHLHDFVRENRLTHAEWREGLAALSQSGEISDEERNEFVLFSDMLGISSLVDLVNMTPGATSSSVLGPFHQRGAPELPNCGDLWKEQAGEVLLIEGQVVDAATGMGICGAQLDLWQNADNGLYSAQDSDQPKQNYHGLLRCDSDGRFCFTTTRFQPYSVPQDGPVGAMLDVLGRTAWRPAHLHVIASAEAYQSLVTELFLSDDEWLDKDAAFGVRPDLVLDVTTATNRDELPALLAARSRLPATFLRTRATIRLGAASCA